MNKNPRIEIEYCTQCRWLLWAAWMVQELLATFSDELGEVALSPGTGGVFDIRVTGSEQNGLSALCEKALDGLYYNLHSP